jgi:hypothetical protein
VDVPKTCMIPLAIRYESGIAIDISANVWRASGSCSSSGSIDPPNARFEEHLFLSPH